ncbi:hypothetical protein PM082_023174 [Marasmius tenuissimus]|nr:hypothetical protein PM082_023174 [Marasmius tenuissimus]
MRRIGDAGCRSASFDSFYHIKKSFDQHDSQTVRPPISASPFAQSIIVHTNDDHTPLRTAQSQEIRSLRSLVIS